MALVCSEGFEQKKKIGFRSGGCSGTKKVGGFSQVNLGFGFGGKMKKFLQYYSVDVPHVLYVDKKDS